MELLDEEKYQQYRIFQKTTKDNKTSYKSFINIAFLFAGMGGITWAIRGTSGWGGMDGAVVHSTMWGVLWYYVFYLRGIDARGISIWLALGCSIGGLWGYGQYVAWIRGMYGFDTGGVVEYIAISPFYGFLWFFLCGAAWLGIAGIILGWALGDRVHKFDKKKWLIRLVIPIFFSIMGYFLTVLAPKLFFPNYDDVRFNQDTCTQCIRLISTNRTNFMAVMWWVGALFVNKLERDRMTFRIGLIMGIGFGFGFGIAGFFTIGYNTAPSFIDWWKVYEISSGFFAGLLYAWVLFIVQKDFDMQQDMQANPVIDTEKEIVSPNLDPNHLKLRAPNKIELRKNLSILGTVAILLLITVYGGTQRLGIVLGMYTEEGDQYAFLPGRILIFVPVFSVILIISAIKIFQHLQLAKEPNYSSYEVKNIHEKVMHLLLFLTFIGVMTIWTTDNESASASKISILYVLFSWMALIGFHKVQRDHAFN